MSLGRRLFLGLLALASAAGAVWILFAATQAGALTGQVFFAILPLAMLFGIAWRGLTGRPD
jgi:hypothetical protein